LLVSPFAVTTLLVPTSSPIRVRACAPACACPDPEPDDSAPVSVRSSIFLTSLVWSLWSGRFARDARVGGHLFGPFLVAGLALAPHCFEGHRPLARLCGEQTIRREQARPGLAHGSQEIVVVRKPEQRDARRGVRVLVRQAEGLEREATRPVEVI